MLGTPAHPYLLCLLPYNGGVLRRGQWGQRGKGWLLHVCTGLPTTEVLVDDGNGLVWIEITSHTDGYVVRTIPLIEIVLDVRDGGVLQVLLRTDGGLKSVRMGRPEHLADGGKELTLVAAQSDIILLIDSLQLGVETTYHHVLESVGLDLCPVLNLVRRDILRIAGHVVRRVGVRPFCTDGSHQLVVLIGDEVLGCHLRHRVDLVVSLLTRIRIRQLAIGLIALFDLCEQRGLCLRVVRAELLRTLEHQVFQVVGQTCRFRRVILRTCTYSDECLDTRFLRVYREIYLQTVVEGIDARLHHIPRNSLILVILGLCTHPEHHTSQRQ